jgi:hypothetical protein
MNNIDFVGEDPVTGPNAQTNKCMTNHNNLTGLQGGTLNERYHLTKAQYESLISGGGGGGSYTFINGIQPIEGGIGLGGNLVQQVAIDLVGAYEFQIVDSTSESSFTFQPPVDGGDSQMYMYNQMNNNYAQVTTNAGNGSSDQAYVDLTVSNGSTYMEIFMSIQNGIEVTDSVFNIGMVYQNDYSANFVDNSLVSKLYVDTAISNAGGGGGTSYTFQNGLTNSTNVVSLGGQLTTANVTIDTNNHIFTVHDAGAAAATMLQFSRSGLVVEISSSSTSAGALLISPTQSEIGVIVAGNQLTFVTTSTGGHIITDSVLHMGVVNAGDYEPNFVPRSLVTKQYVDAAVSGGGGGSSTVTVRDNSTSNIKFDVDSIYGNTTSVLTGDIGFNSVGQVVGSSSTLFHNDTVAPGFDLTYHILTGSGVYVTGVNNLIFCTLVDTNYIVYSITQPS